MSYIIHNFIPLSGLIYLSFYIHQQNRQKGHTLVRTKRPGFIHHIVKQSLYSPEQALIVSGV